MSSPRELIANVTAAEQHLQLAHVHCNAHSHFPIFLSKYEQTNNKKRHPISCASRCSALALALALVCTLHHLSMPQRLAVVQPALPTHSDWLAQHTVGWPGVGSFTTRNSCSLVVALHFVFSSFSLAGLVKVFKPCLHKKSVLIISFLAAFIWHTFTTATTHLEIGAAWLKIRFVFVGVHVAYAQC